MDFIFQFVFLWCITLIDLCMLKNPSGQFSRSVMSDCLLPHGPQHATLSIINSQSLPKLMFIESVMPSKHLILLSSRLLLPSIFLSIRLFSNEESLHPCNKPNLIMVYELFDVLLNSVCSNFVEDFCIYVHQLYWPVVFFFCVVFVWFLYQGDGGLVE